MNSRVLVSVLVMLSCGGPGPSEASFTLSAPTSVVAAAGAPAFVDVQVQRKGGYSGAVSLKADSPFPSRFEKERLRLDLPLSARGKQPVTVTGTDEQGRTAQARFDLDVREPSQPPTRPLSLRVKLDALFYSSGSPVKATVDFGSFTPPTPLPDLVLVSTESHDVERLKLTAASGNTFTAAPMTVSASDASGQALDGAFTVPAGGMFFAMLPVDKSQPGFDSVETSFVSDFAFVDGERQESPKSRVEPTLKLTADETVVPPGGRPVGTLIRLGQGPGEGMPIQLATEELMVFHADDAELQRFLEASGGQALATQDVEGEKPHVTLVKVDPMSLSASRLALLRGLVGDSSELVASKPEIQGIYGLALAFRLEGFVVAVNPRLAYQSAPAVNETTLTPSMQMVGAASGGACMPNDPSRRCALDVPAVWSYLNLLDVDSQRIKVAVLDMGFAPNADFRTNADGGIDQCDMTGRGVRCVAGAALGPPTVGASLFGPRVWHGTGVVTTLGGVVNNGFGGAGVGGQVAVPMLYKYDLASYAFDMGRGISDAVGRGAQVINISAGYPCTAVMSVGPDFDFCSPEGRLGICAVVTAAAHAAALVICSSPAAIVCPIAIGVAVAATDACLSTLALGNVRDPMRSAVRYATSRGVPVVASAGNRMNPESLPAPLRSLVNLEEQRTERWGVIPASLPDVICVGAARTSDFANTHFFGDRVDLWAPEPTYFTSPTSTDDPMSPLHDDSINATSAAAPYVSGTVAAMMAVNPSLDPARASAADRATIVSRVRGILTRTALTNAQLVALGWADNANRRNLVDPFAAVFEASRGVQPDFRGLGYDLSFNFGEAAVADDSPAMAQELAPDTDVAGTVLSFSGVADEDWKFINLGGTSSEMRGADLTVTWLGDEEPRLVAPAGAGPLPRVSSNFTGLEKTTTYRIVSRGAVQIRFAVSSLASHDIAYKVRVTAPRTLTPTMSIVRPVIAPGATVCANRPTQFEVQGTYPFSSATISSAQWTINGTLQATTSLTPTFTRPAGTDTFFASSSGASASIVVTFVNCTASVEIVLPTSNVTRYSDGGDINGPYLLLNFTARALDAAGNVINPSTLVFEWTTNRGDLQPGAPASGIQLLATGATPPSQRIYGMSGSTAETHIITVTIRASPGGPVLATDSLTVTVQQLI